MRLLNTKKLTVALYVFYMLVLSVAVLFKTKMAFSFLHLKINLIATDIQRTVNLVPLGGMLRLNGRLDYGEVLLNVVAFVPMGVFGCMLLKRRSFLGLLWPIALTSLFFEATQYVFAIGACDITDLLANTLGGMAGVGLFLGLEKWCKAKTVPLVNGIGLALAMGTLIAMGMVRPL